MVLAEAVSLEAGSCIHKVGDVGAGGAIADEVVTFSVQFYRVLLRGMWSGRG